MYIVQGSNASVYWMGLELTPLNHIWKKKSLQNELYKGNHGKLLKAKNPINFSQKNEKKIKIGQGYDGEDA